MKTVRIKDLTFDLFLSERQILERVKEMSRLIDKDLKEQHPIFLVVLNGAFMFAADLLKEVHTACEVSFIRLSSYVGTHTSGEVKEIIGLNTAIEGRHVVVVEDIIESGITMQHVLAQLADHRPATVRVASLLVKPESLKVNVRIDYRCFDIPNDFIVGYGLDYDGEGRNLKDIYMLQR